MGSYLRINNGDCWNICCAFCFGLYISQHPQRSAWVPALALVPCPIPRLRTPICIYQPWSPIVFTGSCPKFVFISSFTKFLVTKPGQSRAWACIYLPCHPNLYLLALVNDFCYPALNCHLFLIVVLAVVVVILAIVVISMD